MKAGMFITDEEERELREEHGYNDDEIDTVNRSAQMHKAAEELRAMAAHSAYHRQNPKGPGDGGSARIEGAHQ